MKNVLTRTLLIVFTDSLSWSAVLTGPVVNPANGHQYYLLSGQDWNAAEAEARTLGGHLATVNDGAENNWIFSTFAHFGGVNRNLMLGLNDAEVEGSFAWVSGDPSTYRNWNFGEPNNYTPTQNQDYAVMRPSDGLWNDVALSESTTYNGVVEVLPVGETIFPTITTAVELAWPTLPSKQYQLQWSSTVGPDAQWQNLGAQFAGTGSTYYHLASARDGAARYYRVVVIN